MLKLFKIALNNKKMKEAKSHLVDDRLFFYLFFPLAMNK